MPVDLEKTGKFLKEKRESKGITLEDVSHSLCLRKSLIIAIESGNRSLLPHDVYVRGYIKEYAGLLNVYDEIKDDLVHKEETEIPAEVPVQHKIESKNKQMPKRVVLYPLAFVLIIGFFVLSQINKEQKSTAQIQYTERASNKIIENIDSEIKNPIEAIDTKKLMITCQERTWVSVVIDETEKKEFMLNPEDIIILNAKNTFDLLIGNAGGVKLILDGTDIQFTGVSGEVKRINLS